MLLLQWPMYLTVQLHCPRLPASNSPSWQTRHSSTALVGSVELLRRRISAVIRCVLMCVCGGGGWGLGGKGGGWSVLGFLLFFPAATLYFDVQPQWLSHGVHGVRETNSVTTIRVRASWLQTGGGRSKKHISNKPSCDGSCMCRRGHL